MRFFPRFLFPVPGLVRGLIRGARGHALPSRLDRPLSQGARGHPPRSNEIHETPMSKIQEVTRPGRTAISGRSAPLFCSRKGLWPEAQFPRDRNRVDPPNALSEPFGLSEPTSLYTRQVPHAPSGRARRGTKQEQSNPLPRCCPVFSRRLDYPMAATHLVWMLSADAD